MPPAASNGTPPDGPPTAVVTGGGSGIGEALCGRLARLGWRVAVVDSDLASARRVAAALGALASPHGMDVADPRAWEGLAADLRRQWGRLDLLVNNAGVLLAGDLADCAAEEIERVVRVNLLGALFGCRQMVPWMLESGPLPPGRWGGPRRGVVNIASVFASLAPPGFAAYSASKAGVVACSMALRGELAPRGLNVTAVAPGVAQTALFDRALYAKPRFQEVAKQYLRRSSLTPDDVARAALAASARGARLVAPGRRASIYWTLARWAPGWTLGLVAWQARRQFEGLPPSVAPSRERAAAPGSGDAPPAS